MVPKPGIGESHGLTFQSHLVLQSHRSMKETTSFKKLNICVCLDDNMYVWKGYENTLDHSDVLSRGIELPPLSDTPVEE